jgi:methionine aminotransferase
MYFKNQMIIINNPHNPGKFYRNLILKPGNGKNRIDLFFLMKFMNTSLSEKHISAHTRKKLLNRSVVSSFGKSSMLRMESGLFAPEYLMKEIKSTSVLVFSVNSICQVALVSI